MAIFDVACRSNARIASSRSMPLPLSTADETPSAVFEIYGDVITTGINGVIEQFTHNRSGPVNHLPGLNTVDNVIR